MTSAPPEPSRTTGQRIAYGAAEPQFVDFYLPTEAERPVAVAVLIHGGYWRDRFDLSLMDLLVADALGRGMAVANVEYRRMGNGGGWPTTGRDVEEAMTLVREHWREWNGVVPFISVGHSVGGQLALLNSAAADAVVALAPVTDVSRTDDERLGEDAAVAFMGARAAELPSEYAAASPVRQLPLGRPVLVVHGDVDSRVPVDHSRGFVGMARAAGDVVEYREVPGLDHVTAIDPSASHWPAAAAWMAGQTTR
ncbi:alpha/beta hydrolase [Arthrobacter cavernae]|uniref:Alpha/beta hydrolase n=1 Tax=Arthrobacter cavernae TaxID=2817681 RepID=A0A939HI80_9MICC|nr:alpha/beta hydrolase [Arthrobacter cavernae]MBO1267935.1 alpha/beta hydrolase [Arthrobacter cavernae]